ncbi:hypothetical protein G6F46_008826 [Rhizopus delemar]|uniref:Cytochrome c oxidase assembly protein COX20, mitochondrial n=2 Tax=Rhizopus TaxID=4842 RepID=A0A9P6Z3N5_9FUNG|nr:hypothetical protein G6F43_000900 [Rhizopus delemar]KAG1137131.1 hypothetical protein G6F38_011539 [Rhizopus arrhizus]KAG1146406.1 hypothetical protein G6F37_011974 [Rhizopus arrhizus]KAG1452777.1 hypothetical protein G6F55_008491 [Rhizopus delemar]KAG1492874.1 hypothetical protein G6F54_008985 [Rhizopus delemar]
MSSQQDSPSFVDALKTIKLEDFKEVNKIPCSRNALLYGMAAGVTIGAIRFMSKRIVSTSANWAVGTFCGVSAVSFEMCQMERKQKLEKLRMIVKATDSQRNEKLVITERGKNGAFDVVIETPSKKE